MPSDGDISARELLRSRLEQAFPTADPQLVRRTSTQLFQAATEQDFGREEAIRIALQIWADLGGGDHPTEVNESGDSPNSPAHPVGRVDEDARSAMVTELSV